MINSSKANCSTVRDFLAHYHGSATDTSTAVVVSTTYEIPIANMYLVLRTRRVSIQSPIATHKRAGSRAGNFAIGLGKETSSPSLTAVYIHKNTVDLNGK